MPERQEILTKVPWFIFDNWLFFDVILWHTRHWYVSSVFPDSFRHMSPEFAETQSFHWPLGAVNHVGPFQPFPYPQNLKVLSHFWHTGSDTYHCLVCHKIASKSNQLSKINHTTFVRISCLSLNLTKYLGKFSKTRPRSQKWLIKSKISIWRQTSFRGLLKSMNPAFQNAQES